MGGFAPSSSPFDPIGTLIAAITSAKEYGKDKYPDQMIPFKDDEQFKHDSLMKNRDQHGDRVAGTYGKLPAVLGALPAMGYEAIKGAAKSKSKLLNEKAKDALMYVGRSPLGAAFYGEKSDNWANDPRTTEIFTIDETTRDATPEAVVAYGRGAINANAPLIIPGNLVDALSDLFKEER